MAQVRRIEHREGWFVMERSDVLCGPFESNALAWRYVDRLEGSPISRSEAVSEWVFKQD